MRLQKRRDDTLQFVFYAEPEVAQAREQLQLRLRAEALGIAQIDLAGAGEGERIVHLTPQTIRVPFGVEVVKVTPSIVTLNNVASTIRSERILRISLPSSTNIATGSGSSAAGSAVATEKIPVGINLTVTPQVSSDGYVLLK